ncbi:MAG: lysozyme inhibitor LprI family protein [Pseudomonadota bacterium]
MKRIQCTISFSMLLLAPAAGLAQRSESTAETCYSVGGHADAKECMEKRAAQSAGEVRKIEAEFRKALAKTDAEPSEKHRTLAAFDASSKEYTRYRRAQCEVRAALAFGGNSASDSRWLCQIELDARRVADIRRAIEGMPPL